MKILTKSIWLKSTVVHKWLVTSRYAQLSAYLTLKKTTMILSFSTQLNGKPTYFVEKISKSVKSILFSKKLARRCGVRNDKFST